MLSTTAAVIASHCLRSPEQRANHFPGVTGATAVRWPRCGQRFERSRLDWRILSTSWVHIDWARRAGHRLVQFEDVVLISAREVFLHPALRSERASPFLGDDLFDRRQYASIEASGGRLHRNARLLARCVHPVVSGAGASLVPAGVLPAWRCGSSDGIRDHSPSLQCRPRCGNFRAIVERPPRGRDPRLRPAHAFNSGSRRRLAPRGH